MIQLNELRIGNLVLYNEQPVYVDLDLLNGFEDYKSAGIPLTEKWLRRFGFIDTNGGYRATGAEVVYEFNTGGRPIRLWWDWPDAWVFESWNDLSLKYVHHLQNLYFALTGEELTIKEPS